MRVRALLCLPLLLAACEATMPPPPGAVPEPAPSGKAQLDESDLAVGVLPVQKAMDDCISLYRANGTPEVSMVIEPNGRPSSVKIYRIVNFTETRCLERALRAAKFPAFSGPAMRIVRQIVGNTPDGGTPAHAG